MSVAFSAFRSKVPTPPRIFRDPNEKMQTIHPSYYGISLKNVFLDLPTLKGSILGSIILPRSFQLEVSNAGIVMRNRFLKIIIGYQVYQWSRSIDLRVENLLGLSKERNQLASISAVITLEAKPRAFWVDLPEGGNLLELRQGSVREFTYAL